MLYPMPSDVALVDNDADGASDRLFVPDLRGQLWRVDIGPDLATGSASLKAVVGMLATMSGTTSAADKRRFFYPPDVVRVPAGETGSSGLHDLVVITSGDRAHPLDLNVQDRIYAFRDFRTRAMIDADGDGLADAASYPTLQGALVDPLTAGDLLNVTDLLDFTDSANLTALTSAKGWYIDLEEPGEKSLAGPVVLAGQLFITSYLPEGVVNLASCSLQEGSGRLYGLNVLTGEPLKNWDESADDTVLTKPDRVYALGSGIPSQAVPIFQEEGITLLVGGGGGATAVDPGIQLPRVRTYWYQEEGG
jgi:type IV pilus assembly protein PilY1